ncbi:hypothetical protein STSP2_00382 [Anaerohalosphaera lusitana]|uniref:Uncharacterized protein n=1 Tax=Anaerohalosphaera lusitana TaxID=1936003 RepID=A0A1U9NH40_9BACT|nr:hypothetical protein [Anaerohalosphaera lusitana]AQT67239.1 hypothetical protein STSP2_00382 [Anaerohalosphaera lusitana]
MSKHKRIRNLFLLLAVLVGAVVAMVMVQSIRERNSPAARARERQIAMAREMGFLQAQGAGAGYYVDAAEKLKSIGYSEDVFRELRKTDKALDQDLVSEEAIKLILEGCRQEEMGLKAFSLWSMDYEVEMNGKTVDWDDIYLCMQYMKNLSKSAVDQSDTFSFTTSEIWGGLFSTGVQLSEYENDILRVLGISCKTQAVAYMLDEAEGERKSELQVIESDVEKEFEKVKSEL